MSEAETLRAWWATVGEEDRRHLRAMPGDGLVPLRVATGMARFGFPTTTADPRPGEEGRSWFHPPIQVARFLDDLDAADARAAAEAEA
ncbi:hypothetical protein [Kineococcus arenarius]|uniref:hypothetical protein n=1 Tax=unclassified Kineococcus TaxID=2621656 RepID=UPI003D7D41E2